MLLWQKYKGRKETDTYTITAYDESAEVRFDFVKDDKYKISENNNKLTFTDESNKSTMEVSLIHDRLKGPNITKTEEDFYDEAYHDFNEVEEFISSDDFRDIFDTIQLDMK
ncbi:MAG: hypothetical protein K5888_00775 [Lachnospiraceae bacterium]|nr:hypothetical protein [Lachnospiraceae bacterium]